MHHHGLWSAIAAAVLAASIDSAAAWDDAKQPDLQRHWARFVVRGLPGQPSFDQTKPCGAGQQAPLTPEYRTIFVAPLADQAKGCEDIRLAKNPSAAQSAVFPAQARR
jgi:hypothetical protein